VLGHSARPPRSNQKFFQIKKADRDEEKAKQARMQLYWRQFRDPDFDPNQYHVHHSVHLFIGGEDNLRTNAITLPKGIHLKGHQVLRTQPQMQFPLVRYRHYQQTYTNTPSVLNMFW